MEASCSANSVPHSRFLILLEHPGASGRGLAENWAAGILRSSWVAQKSASWRERKGHVLPSDTDWELGGKDNQTRLSEPLCLGQSPFSLWCPSLHFPHLKSETGNLKLRQEEALMS